MTDGRRPRYAIYFTPPPASALWRFGSRVIGYDAYGSLAAAASRHAQLAPLLRDEQLAEPARYGFHATLRAPFELATGKEASDVLVAARTFAAIRAPVDIGELQVSRLGGFVALVCVAPPPELAQLAATCVRHFEPLRAPLSSADRARRLGAPLTARQQDHLDLWGYPYVMDDFTFHMTLTGPLDERTIASTLPVLQQLHAKIAAPVTIDAISVLEQPARTEPFHVIGRFQLSAAKPG